MKNMRLSEQRSSMLHGVLLIALFACAAFYIGGMDWVKALSFSPMVVGIIIGMLYANSLRNNLPDTWVPGIKFCSKRILRTGIILYGFKLTFQDVMAVGVSAIVMDAIIVCGTIGLGILVGRLLKIDRSIALLRLRKCHLWSCSCIGCGWGHSSEALQDGSSRSHRSHLWNIIHVPLPYSLQSWHL